MFSERLKLAIQHAGIKEHGAAAAIARLLKVTPKAVSKWMNDEAVPRRDKIIMIAQRTGVRSAWLEYGEGEMLDSVQNVEPAYFREAKRYPVISWVQAGEWREMADLPVNYHSEEWEYSDCNTSEQSFWLRVVGDSMTASVGLSIPEGHLILVDPETAYINGSLVVAVLSDTNEATFKKLVIDAGRKYLKPLNPNYRTIEINGNCEIVGVVREIKLTL